MDKVEILVGGKNLVFQTGKLAKQADGAVVVEYGGTVVLVSVVGAREAEADQDFFPLTVDYRERTYAAGRIPGGFFKRDGRPRDREILTSRLIDRPLRPLFPEGFFNEVQIIGATFSSDQENSPDILAIMAASLALCLSPVPFAKPVAAVRVGRVNGGFIVNPTFSQLKESDLDLVVAGTDEAVTMIEGGSNELGEEEVLKAIEFAHQEIRRIVGALADFVRKNGKPKLAVELTNKDAAVANAVKDMALEKLRKANQSSDKLKRQEDINQINKETLEALLAQYPEKEKDIKGELEALEVSIVRHNISGLSQRADGRRLDEVRPISCEVGVLPRTHGSSLFTRGQTQALVVATLGTGDDAQIIENLEGESKKTYMLHYNFPPFSVGEIKPMRGPGRREIGHGMLAERALVPVLPKPEEFPYVIQVVSEILESNGSSSMASVCGATLALMDAGVPIKAPVAGIAMGLIKEDSKFTVLTDIQGLEDHFGDMDFKVAGTAKGITAIQMDIKISGITSEIMRKALEQAKQGRMFILGKMQEALAAPRSSLSAYAPRLVTIQVNPKNLGILIGPGGKNIKRIVEESGAKVDIEDSGKVFIASPQEEAVQKAIKMIKECTAEPEIGKIYLGKVQKIMDFGAFVEVLPGTDGLVHISQLAPERVGQVNDVVSEGDMVVVKVLEIDPAGKIRLSRKEALVENKEFKEIINPQKSSPAPRRERR